ncbi:hypothetical protein HYZ97_01535 [Candidatus Pacearchaeota archaeon]|nr:hypothetical protein [Candidatus Pacearchaeota archaeon]
MSGNGNGNGQAYLIDTCASHLYSPRSRDFIPGGLQRKLDSLTAQLTAFNAFADKHIIYTVEEVTQELRMLTTQVRSLEDEQDFSEDLSPLYSAVRKALFMLDGCRVSSVQMTSIQKTIFRYAFRVSEIHSSRTSQESEGGRLQTDRRLAATTFALAISSPIILLTRDEGLAETLVEMVPLVVDGMGAREYFTNPIGLCKPHFEECLNIDSVKQVYSPS